ncbi:MAG: hypothetical protein NMNS01_04050 [Nitrosomonas sp.]|jgi:hypothetical protein|nr:MAG: hypothetical protein NMNS01_04050 [Nitrosomonas sp.]
MEAIDGSMGFDFAGTFTRFEPNKVIEYKLEDDRVVSVKFSKAAEKTIVVEKIDVENRLKIS